MLRPNLTITSSIFSINHVVLLPLCTPQSMLKKTNNMSYMHTNVYPIFLLTHLWYKIVKMCLSAWGKFPVIIRTIYAARSTYIVLMNMYFGIHRRLNVGLVYIYIAGVRNVQGGVSDKGRWHGQSSRSHWLTVTYVPHSSCLFA